MHTGQSFSRRTFLSSIAVSAAGAILAACGESSGSGNSSTPPAGATKPTAAPGSAPTTTTGTMPTVAPNAAGGSQASTANIPTPRNQTVIFIIDGQKIATFDSFNPFIPNGEQTNAGIHQSSRESMFYFNFPTNKLVPWLATKWEYNPDFTQMTLSLNPAATWSDGQPFTADDVAFTVNLLLNNKQFNGYSAVQDTTNVAAQDAHTVAFTLKRSNPRFHYGFIAGIWGDAVRVVPKHVWEKQDANSFRNNPPVYTGAYTLERADPNLKLYIWKKSANYWNKATLDPKPQYLVWQEPVPQDAIIEEFVRGNMDNVNGTALDYLGQQAIKDRYKSAVFLPFTDPCPGTFYFNQDSPTGLFAKPEGRWAMSYLIDRDQIANNLSQPASRSAKYPWADYPSNDKWANAAIQQGNTLTYDPNKAGQLLDSLGATKQGDTRNLNGKPLSLNLILGDPAGTQSYQIAQSLAMSAKKVGIDIQVRSLIGTTFSDAYALGQYDIRSFSLCGLALDPAQLYSRFETQYYKPIGTRSAANFNETRSQIPELDAIATKLDNLNPDDPNNKPLFDQGLEAFMKNLPAAPITQQVRPQAYNNAYWSGWPTESNVYSQPTLWWAHALFVIGKLQPTGK